MHQSKTGTKTTRKLQKRHPVPLQYQPAKIKKGDTIFDILKRDHKEIQKICQLILARSTPPSQILPLFNQLRDLVSAHTQAEETVFYDLIHEAADVENDDEGAMKVLQGYEEHHIISIILDELSSVKTNDPVFFAKMKVFSEVMDRHIQIEESTIFGAAKKDLDLPQPREMAVKFVEEKNILLPH